MKDIKVWQFILEQMQQQLPVVFLCVLHSEGSSPGRQGFKMAVSASGMCGSVGGGIMEHKFVELARQLLHDPVQKGVMKKQVHAKNAVANQSGMICSGEQTLAIYPVKVADRVVIKKIISALKKNSPCVFSFSLSGFLLSNNVNMQAQFLLNVLTENEFMFTEKLGYAAHIHIIGGGHCSIALSKLMAGLNFFISVYDDRQQLNTMEQNGFAHTKKIIRYENISKTISISENDFVVIMTFGYRTDDVVLRQLIQRKTAYLGVLGSKTKIAKMFKALRADGISKAKLQAIKAPIGLPINSRTPEEIAISIAAQIIAIINRPVKLTT